MNINKIVMWPYEKWSHGYILGIINGIIISGLIFIVLVINGIIK